MKLGMVIRTMGPQSTRDTILRCAAAAESAGIDEVCEALRQVACGGKEVLIDDAVLNLAWR